MASGAQDGPALAADGDGRQVPLGERIPDRSVDVLEIVLLRERFAEAALAQRAERANRAAESTAIDGLRLVLGDGMVGGDEERSDDEPLAA